MNRPTQNGPKPSRKRLDDVLILALAYGASAAEAARQAGCSERTVWRRLAHPEFAAQLQYFKRSLFERAAGILCAASLQSVKTLVAALGDDTAPSVRHTAVRTLLERQSVYRKRAEVVSPPTPADDSEPPVSAAVRRSRRDDKLVFELACGTSMVRAAQNAGCSERTVRRRMAEPEFQERVERLREEMLERATAMLTAASTEAAKTAVALQAPGMPRSVQVSAARTVLHLAPVFHDQVVFERQAEFRLLAGAPGREGPEAMTDAEEIEWRELLIGIRDVLRSFPEPLHAFTQWGRGLTKGQPVDDVTTWAEALAQVVNRYPETRPALKSFLEQHEERRRLRRCA